MIAANRRGHRSHRSSRRGSSPPPSGPKTKSYGLVEGAGGVAIAEGLGVFESSSTGNVAGAIRGLPSGRTNLAAVKYAIKEAIPLVGTESSRAPQRAAIAGGVIAAVGGPVLRKIPLIRKVARKSWKIDKHLRVRVA